MWLFSTLCVATTTAVVHCRLVLWSVDRPIVFILFLLIAERVKIMRWMFLLLTAGELKEAYNTIQYYKKWKWFMVVIDSLHSSIAAYERTARCKFIGQVDFSSWLDRRRQKISTVTLLQTDSTRLRRPKSTYSTRLAGLVVSHFQRLCDWVTE